MIRVALTDDLAACQTLRRLVFIEEQQVSEAKEVDGLDGDALHLLASDGTRLLGTMEQYARSQGITNYHLETTSFQALPFYQKQGYAVFGELPDMPPGHITYFLKKRRD